jgi:hypothetical protein
LAGAEQLRFAIRIVCNSDPANVQGKDFARFHDSYSTIIRVREAAAIVPLHAAVEADGSPKSVLCDC